MNYLNIDRAFGSINLINDKNQILVNVRNLIESNVNTLLTNLDERSASNFVLLPNLDDV